MNDKPLAKASITIDAPPRAVWEALTKPELVGQYLFGTEVTTFLSALSGLPDIPENNKTVRYELSAEGDMTRVSISQDNNNSQAEADHSEQNWRIVLEGMKKLLEE